MSDSLTSATDILYFWFGDLDADGMADEAHSSQWWQKSEAFDTLIRERFARLHDRAVLGHLDHWTHTPDGRLAFVILLDQFSRNMFRDTPQMYAADPLALTVAKEGIEQRVDIQLPFHHRVFLYMPLMHAENLETQNRCVELFERLAEQSRGRAAEAARGNLDFAIAHRDIVARFGRFPHRNEILGRESTPEEKAFLEQPGSSF